MEVEKIDATLRILHREPWLPYKATEYMDRLDLAWNKRVLEWGAGSSTLWFLDSGANLVSVENDASWLTSVSLRLDLGRVDWWPILILEKESWEPFANAVVSIDGKFDVILIDGAVIDGQSSRKLCVPLAQQKIAKGGCVILDNSDTSIEEAEMLKSSCSSYTLIYGEGYLGKWETGFYFYD